MITASYELSNTWHGMGFVGHLVAGVFVLAAVGVALWLAR